MLIEGEFASFNGIGKLGVGQNTQLYIPSIEAMVEKEKNPTNGRDRFFVITTSGNAYPIGERDYFTLLEAWQQSLNIV